MPFANLKQFRMHYKVAGAEDAPVLVLSNSLGTNLSMWDAQASELSQRFRLLRYDKRGHGESEGPPGPYTVEMLARDVIELLDFLRIETVHFCGLSIGGQTGIWLGVNAPKRLKSLTLSNTAAQIGTLEAWTKRIDAVRQNGTASIFDGVIERWFTSDFRAKNSAEVLRIRRMLETTAPQGYIGCCSAVRDFDYRDKVAAIRTRTLVITGSQDQSAPAADGRWMAIQIAGSRHIELPAAHLSNIEAARPFTEGLLQFLTA
jgi:3-oxoadipate enol-lactonase